jgi:hypothetical protein
MTDETSFEYKVAVVGPGIKVEKPVEESKALSVLQVIMSNAPASSVPGHSVSAAGTPVVGRGQRLSLREFLEDSGAKNNPAKIVVMGRFLRDLEGQSDFSREEIKARFRSAGEPLPGNLPRDFTAAIASAWIAEDPSNVGRYYVTRKGDESAEKNFVGSSPTTKGRKRRGADNAETA